MNIGTLLPRHAKYRPDHLALVVGETLEPEELIEWSNSRVDAKFQRISDVAIMGSFPRNVAGKTLKREIRTRYKEGISIS